MDYIVSPWLVYLIGISSAVQGLCIGVGIGFVLTGVLLCMGFPDGFEFRKKWLFVPIISFCILIMGILIPSKETIIQMIIAKNLTYTNAGIIVTEGKNLKDELKKDVIDIILAVKEKK